MRGTQKPNQQSERTGHVEALLDDALRMTFPASDPIAPAIDTAAISHSEPKGEGSRRSE